MTKFSAFAGAALGALMLATTPALADGAGFNTVDGVALHGFDPVAYFTQHKPVKGWIDNTATYEGITYEFANKQNLATFQKNPAKYIPNYHGFCTTAVAEGAKADIDPHAFEIHDGKLNVFYSDDAKAAFDKDPTGTLKKAEANWPTVQTQQKVIR